MRGVLSEQLSRRGLLSLPLLLCLGPRPANAASEIKQTFGYVMDLSILFDVFSFSAAGTLTEEIDPTGQRYRVTISGQGAGVTTRTEGLGVIREGRFLPTRTESFHTLRGRETRLLVKYDYGSRLVEYHGLSHTLLLGRRRQVDDLLAIPEGQRLDDLISANLNFAADALERGPDGTYRTAIVRRARPRTEGPDDVSPTGYRAEIVPVRFRVGRDPSTGRLAGEVDISAFSSWARDDQPARVTFSAERRVEAVQCAFILGTKLALRLTRAA
jgi:hypothetical protein